MPGLVCDCLNRRDSLRLLTMYMHRVGNMCIGKRDKCLVNQLNGEKASEGKGEGKGERGGAGAGNGGSGGVRR